MYYLILSLVKRDSVLPFLVFRYRVVLFNPGRSFFEATVYLKDIYVIYVATYLFRRLYKLN